jgi:hypothetical protein
MSHEEFFKENATNPTAYSVGAGRHVSFSVSNEIYKRDEVEIKKLVSKYGLKTMKSGGFMTFHKGLNEVEFVQAARA